MPDMVDGRQSKSGPTGPAAGVPAFRHLPRVLGPEIGRLVDSSPIIARRAFLRLPDGAKTHTIAQSGVDHAGIPLRVDLLRAVLFLNVGPLIHQGFTILVELFPQLEWGGRQGLLAAISDFRDPRLSAGANLLPQRLPLFRELRCRDRFSCARRPARLCAYQSQSHRRTDGARRKRIASPRKQTTCMKPDSLIQVVDIMRQARSASNLAIYLTVRCSPPSPDRRAHRVDASK